MDNMFAFAVWDEFKQELFIVRDPLGIKPVYYSEFVKGIVFASELKALKIFDPHVMIDPQGARFFLEWGSIPAPNTIYKNVKALEAGCYLKITHDKIAKVKYWDYAEILTNASEVTDRFKNRNEAVEFVREQLRDAVQAHLISDVPIGVYLSGGIDSSAIVSLMADLGHREIRTFSVGFNHERLDESKHAQEVSNFYGTSHTNYQFGKEDFKTAKSCFLMAMDQPSFDGLNTFMVSSLARSNGCQVALSGIGGDEVFGGYARDFQQGPRVVDTLNAVGVLPRLIARFGVNALLEMGLLKPKWKRFASFLSRQPSLAAWMEMNRGIFTHWETPKFFKCTDFAHEVSAVSTSAFHMDIPENLCQHDKVSALLLKRYLGPQLLRDSDNNSMAFTIELRTPFVDRVLYESLAKIRNKDWYYSNEVPKSILVDAIGDLPRSITHRKKQGFIIPLEHWLDEDDFELKSELLDPDIFSTTIKDYQRGAIHWSRLWALIVLDRFFSHA